MGPDRTRRPRQGLRQESVWCLQHGVPRTFEVDLPAEDGGIEVAKLLDVWARHIEVADGVGSEFLIAHAAKSSELLYFVI